MVLRMANVLANELGEFVTCGICTSEFDAEIRKPKFLQCAHTVCLLCLEKICHDETIVCPFCCKTSTQLDVNKLPNNGYILHMLNMLKFEEGKPKPASPVAISKGPSWCLTCGTLRKVTCTTPEHSSVNLTSFTLKNIEALVGLKEDLLEAKPEVASDLALSIKKRKKFKKHLKLLIKALTATIEEIDELQDENYFQMSQTNTELNEVRQVTATPHISDENFLSNLSSLLDDLNPKDMPAMDSLKFKLNKSFEDFEKRFQETVTAASYHELRGKLRIKISLFDKEDRPIPSTCPLFEQGFSLDKTSVLDNSLQQDLNLLSCLIFSLLRRQKIPLKATASSFPDPFPSVAQDPNPVLPSEDDRSQEKGPSVSQDRSPVLSPDDNIRSQEKIPSVLESIGRTGSPEISLPFSLPVNNKFIPGQSIFILRLWQCSILKGAIYIRPEPTFHPGFTQSLGEFCFQFPKIFFVSAMKALPEGLVLFPMTHPMFQPFLPDIISNFNRQMSRCTISGVDDVGVNKFIVSACHNKIIGWNFVFPIQCATLQPLAPVAELFGRVIHRQMSVSMVELSGSQAIDYTLTLESR